ncbi:efflux pump antibiotic resistance protein [Xylariaceae sp. FL1272]|nr:efflux pump antibiotic resistance protein [Xylariaceae sp. FL1272]
MAATVAATELQCSAEYCMTQQPSGTDGDAAKSTRGNALQATNNIATEHGLSIQPEYPSGIELWLIIVTVGAVLVLGSIDQNIVATAVPSITDHFHTVADVAWYSSAFRLTSCAFQFIFGKAYTLFSAKRVYLLANGITIAGSLLCATASISTILVVGRAVAGVGAAGLFSGSWVIIVQAIPLRRRPLFVGIFSGIEGLATLIAPILGGALTQSLGWRWCFYIAVPIGVVTFLLTVCCLSDTQKTGDIARMTFMQKILQLDLLSNLLFLPALTTLFLAFSWAGTKHPWNSGKVIGPLVTFAVLLAAFVYNQIRRGDAAAVPPRIIKRRTVIAGFIFIMCTNSTANVLEYYLPTYYQTVRGYSPARSGYMMFPIIVGATIGSFIHGAGTSAFGYYAPFMLIGSVLMPIGAGLVTTFKIDTNLAQLILYTALSGLAYGIGFTGPSNAVQTVLPADDVSLGLAVILFAQSFGPAVAIAVAQVFFTNQLSTNLDGLVPGLSPTSIENSSLAEIISSVPQVQAADVLVGIDKSLAQTWYLVVGLAGATIVGSGLIEWRSVKTKRA